MKAYNLGDNGYAWEEAILGGRLFVKGSPGTWTTVMTKLYLDFV